MTRTHPQSPHRPACRTLADDWRQQGLVLSVALASSLAVFFTQNGIEPTLMPAAAYASIGSAGIAGITFRCGDHKYTLITLVAAVVLLTLAASDVIVAGNASDIAVLVGLYGCLCLFAALIGYTLTDRASSRVTT